MNLEPLQDNVLVEQAEAADRTASGIYIPDTAKEKPQQGTVVAVGPGRTENGVFVSTNLKAGDRIIYKKYSGSEVKIDGKEVFLIPERDVIAKIN